VCDGMAMNIKSNLLSGDQPPGHERLPRNAVSPRLNWPNGIATEHLLRAGVLIAAMENWTSAPRHLKDVMFSQVLTTKRDYVWVDYSRRNSKLAPFVSQYAKGSSVPRERHKSSIFHPPHINPVRVLTADDMFNHRPGSVEVATDAYLIARDIEDLDKRITRTEE